MRMVNQGTNVLGGNELRLFVLRQLAPKSY